MSVLAFLLLSACGQSTPSAPEIPAEVTPAPAPPPKPRAPRHNLEVQVDADGAMAIVADGEEVSCGEEADRCPDPESVLEALEVVLEQPGWEGHESVFVVSGAEVRHDNVTALLDLLKPQFPKVALKLQ